MPYPFDYATCTARDVIKHSIDCHPSLFAEKLLDTAKVHGKYAMVTHDRHAHASALTLANACACASKAVSDGGFNGQSPEDYICGELNMKIVAFSAACDFQLVPRHLRGDIIDRAESVS